MDFKFITLNILHGGVFWNNIVSFINSQKPDILALQEVFNSHDISLEKRFRTIDEFSSEFDFLPYYAFEPTMIDKTTNAPWGNAVFSKFPITAKKGITFNGEVFAYDFTDNDPDPTTVTEGMLEANIDIDGKETVVYSWHGVWDRHGNDSPKRFEMEDIIVSAISGKHNVILAGDANLRPDTKFVRDIEEKLNLKSVFGTELPSTFNMLHKTNPDFATESVDKIFISPEFKILSKEMPRVDVSDHYPLVVELEI